MNPNDRIREQMLQYFYDRNAAATSRTGKKGSGVKISDVKRELKERHGLKQQHVMSNLTYLIDNDWVKTLDVHKTVTVRRGTVPSTTTFYEVTAKGIDRIEGGSQFEPRSRYAGISITATGSNIITLGDGNVVNSEFNDLHRALGDLKEAITANQNLGEAQKLNFAVDVESIREQLAKPEPSRGVISHLWSAVEKLGAIEGLAAAVTRVHELLSPLLT